MNAISHKPCPANKTKLLLLSWSTAIKANLALTFGWPPQHFTNGYFMHYGGYLEGQMCLVADMPSLVMVKSREWPFKIMFQREFRRLVKMLFITFHNCSDLIVCFAHDLNLMHFSFLTLKKKKYWQEPLPFKRRQYFAAWLFLKSVTCTPVDMTLLCDSCTRPVLSAVCWTHTLLLMWGMSCCIGRFFQNVYPPKHIQLFIVYPWMYRETYQLKYDLSPQNRRAVCSVFLKTTKPQRELQNLWNKQWNIVKCQLVFCLLL